MKTRIVKIIIFLVYMCLWGITGFLLNHFNAGVYSSMFCGAILGFLLSVANDLAEEADWRLNGA